MIEKRIPALLFMFLFSCAAPIQAEPGTELSLVNFLQTDHFRKDPMFATEDSWKYGGYAVIGTRITPSFDPTEGFQANALIDVDLYRNYKTGQISSAVKELFSDILLYDSVAFKCGFFKIDYGYQSYFHPLAVTDFIPEFNRLYGKLSLGNEDYGFKGVPAAELRVTSAGLFPDILFNLSQKAAFINFDDFLKNYYTTSLSCVVADVNFGLTVGYSSRSLTDEPWTSDSPPPVERRKPVVGASLSALLPFNIMFFFEGTYKFESTRPFVSGGKIVEYRDDRFIDFSVKLDYGFTEPVFSNACSLNIEYFYYDEGLTEQMYDDIVSFLSIPGNLAYYYGIDAKGTFRPQLLVPERNFMHAIRLSAGYMIQSFSVGANYALIYYPQEAVFDHILAISKDFGTVITAVKAHLLHGDDKYIAVNAAGDFSLSMVLDVKF